MKLFGRFNFIILFVLSIILVGCSSNNTPASKRQSESNKEPSTTEELVVDVSEITEFHQSPILDNKELPNINERLPKEPKIPNELPPEYLDVEVGKYGGTLNTVTMSVNWDADFFVMANEALLNTPGVIGQEVTGNILKDYEVTEDQKVFTFHMREGLKWSDGMPVTSEDVRFAVEDVQFNEELVPILPAWLHSGGNVDGSPMEFEIVDDYTFKISFDEPNGGFPISVAVQSWRSYADLLKPAHYLKQFHKNYADPDELEKLIAEHEFAEDQESSWVNFFHYMDITGQEMSHANAISFPVLYPWMLTEMTKTYGIYERNPYYFKVDTEGNQLPYIDTVKSTIVQDIEMVGLKVIAGEVDFNREATALSKMPVYRENAEKGGYEALLANMHNTPSNFFLNLTYDDPIWREVVNDIRFRQALNYAIDRDEIIETLYYGFAEPSKIINSSFDIEKANKLLDEMGMKKGTDGYRIGPDGKRFSIPIEVMAAAPDIVPLAELLTEMWKEVGIHVTVKTLDGALWGTRNTANEIKASIMWVPTPLYYQQNLGQELWGNLWSKWWKSGGQNGEEPPEDVKEFLQLMDKMNVSPPEEALKVMAELREKMKENVYFFVHIENVKQPLIVNSKLGNITDQGTAISVNFAAEQFYYQD